MKKLISLIILLISLSNCAYSQTEIPVFEWKKVMDVQDMALDKDNNLYVIFDGIKKFDAQGNLLMQIENLGVRSIRFTTDIKGNYYVAANSDRWFNYGGTMRKVEDAFGLAKHDKNGNLIWFKTSNKNTSVNQIITDKNGNTFLCGFYKDKFIFDSKEILESIGDKWALYLMMLDPFGDVKWCKSVKSNTQWVNSEKLWLNTDGSLMFAGIYSGDCQYDSIIIGESKSIDYFIAHCDRAGRLLNVYNSSELKNDGFVSISSDSQGNIYALTKVGEDNYITKYDESCKILWSNKINNSNIVVNDNLGNIYISGIQYANQEIVYGSDTLRYLNQDFAMGKRKFIIKINADGEFQWINTVSLPNSTSATSQLIVDKSGSIYSAIQFRGVSSLNDTTIISPYQIFNGGFGPFDAIGFLTKTGMIRTIRSTNASCDEKADGSLTILMNNGVPPFHYSINNGKDYQSDSTFTQLKKGAYDIVVKDATDSTQHTEFILNGPLELGSDIEVYGYNTKLIAPDGFTSYEWFNESSAKEISVSLKDRTLTPSKYYLNVTNSDDCKSSDTIAIYFYYYYGINSLQNTQNLKIYPNPTTGLLYIEFTPLNNEDCHLSIQTLDGRTITQKHYPKTQSLNDTFDLSQFAKGAYLVKVVAGSISKTLKHVMQ